MGYMELLKLAAKAAGAASTTEARDGLFVQWSPNLRGFELWNPLADDGDALRLANRLRMRIEHHIRHPFVAVFAGSDFNTVKIEEPLGSDENAATRRAIVRAAAEIGKGADQ